MPVPSRPTLVASVLTADHTRLGDQVQDLEKSGVDRVQWDVMDGRFVPNLAFGPATVAAHRHLVDMEFEAHLMVQDPDPMLPQWVEAGCGVVIVHAESTGHLHRTLGRIRELGARAGVALNPSTGLSAVEHVLDLVDLILVMTVDPGFGGQSYLASMEPKLVEARARIERSGYDIELEVDGGIRAETIGAAAAAGASVVWAGSALLDGPGSLPDRVETLCTAATRAMRR